MKNFAGKEDTAFTVQYDFVAAERFDLSYVDEKGKKAKPIVIHRSSIGAMERTIALLIEHYAGAFPVWLAPVQVWVVPIGEKHQKYAESVHKKLIAEGLRSELKDESETLSKKIRESELQKIPYVLIMGDKEIKENSVGARERKGDSTSMMKLEKFIEKIKEDINLKK